ncbi:PepSY-like domain-containing protein [Salinimicrobium sp. CAU 1759]
MKKLFLTGIGLLFSTALTFAQADMGKLPQSSQDFLKKHFSSEQVAKVEKNDSWYNWDKDEMYEVKLANGIKLDFNKAGEVTEIDSKEGFTIPLQALPQAIRAYLEQNNLTDHVVSWEKEDDGHEVQLADGRELEFDSSGKFLKED